MAIELLLLILASLVLLHFYVPKHFTFWKNAGIKCIQPPTYWGAIKGTFFGTPKYLYTFEPNEPYIGVIRITSLAISIRDPDMIRSVLTKDFNHFHDRGVAFNEKKDPLSSHIIFLGGKRWKSLRAKLTPTFSSVKLREMFPLVKYCIDQMTAIVTDLADKPEAVEMKDLLSRCTTDIILSCAFGLQGNSLKDPNDIYFEMVKRNFKASRSRFLLQVLVTSFPALSKIIPPSKERRDITNFFVNAFSATVSEREKSGTKRNDFLDLLLEIKKNGYVAGHSENVEDIDPHLKFTNELMTAQAWVFFAAGSETTSSATAFALVELANNIDIQEKLRSEIDESIEKHGGLTYEGIMEMKYLDKVVSETLRRHPPAPILTRTVTKPYTMPDGRVTLPMGTRMIIHLLGLHHDPKYYPEPEKFDPERFTAEAIRKRHKYVYLPFGEGPRLCIGLRFGLLQVKLTLATLISQFEFQPKPGVPYPPVLSEERSIITIFKHGAPCLSGKAKCNEPKLLTQ